MRLLIALALALVSPHMALGQTPAGGAASGEPRFTILAGIGNAMGGFPGAQVELARRSGRISLFGGVGYLPEFEAGYASGVTAAAGVRAFTAGTTHRGFLELSVSPLVSEYDTDGTTRIPGAVVYGPGAQAGYQFIARGGLTALLSVGAGIPIGAESGAGVQLMAGMGLGYTWRR